RTSFHWEGLEEPLQIVHGDVDIPIERCDWRGLSADAQKAKLNGFLKENRERGVDIAQPPLMRLLLIRIGIDTWQLVWTVHHTVMDRWSVSQILGELISIYDAICGGRRIELSPVRPYGDYIGWLQEQDPARAESYWKRKLAGFTS